MGGAVGTAKTTVRAWCARRTLRKAVRSWQAGATVMPTRCAAVWVWMA